MQCFSALTVKKMQVALNQTTGLFFNSQSCSGIFVSLAYIWKDPQACSKIKPFDTPLVTPGVSGDTGCIEPNSVPLPSAGGWSQKRAWQCGQSSASCRCCGRASSWSWSDAPQWGTGPCGNAWRHNVLQSVAGTWRTSLSRQCNPVGKQAMVSVAAWRERNTLRYFT